MPPKGESTAKDLAEAILDIRNKIYGLSMLRSYYPELEEALQSRVEDASLELAELMNLYKALEEPKTEADSTQEMTKKLSAPVKIPLSVPDIFLKINSDTSVFKAKVDFDKLPDDDSIEALLFKMSQHISENQPAEAAHLALQLEIFFQQYSITGKKIVEIEEVVAKDVISKVHPSVLLWFKGLVALYGVNRNKEINYVQANKLLYSSTTIFEASFEASLKMPGIKLNNKSFDFVKHMRLQALMRWQSLFVEESAEFVKSQTEIILLWESLYGKPAYDSKQEASVECGGNRLTFEKPEYDFGDRYFEYLEDVQQLFYSEDKKLRKTSGRKTPALTSDYLPHLTSGYKKADLIASMRWALYLIKQYSPKSKGSLNKLLKAAQLLRFVATFSRIDLRHLSCHQELPIKALALLYLSAIEKKVLPTLNKVMGKSYLFLFQLNIYLAFSGEEQYYDKLTRLLAGNPEAMLGVILFEYQDLSFQQFNRINNLLIKAENLPQKANDFARRLKELGYKIESKNVVFKLKSLLGDPDALSLNPEEINRDAAVAEEWRVDEDAVVALMEDSAFFAKNRRESVKESMKKIRESICEEFDGGGKGEPPATILTKAGEELEVDEEAENYFEVAGEEDGAGKEEEPSRLSSPGSA